MKKKSQTSGDLNPRHHAIQARAKGATYVQLGSDMFSAFNVHSLADIGVYIIIRIHQSILQVRMMNVPAAVNNIEWNIQLIIRLYICS